MQRPNFNDPASVERLFIQAVERGDRKAIIFALDNAPDLNINCTDQDDRPALLISIQNGNSGSERNIYNITAQLTNLPNVNTRVFSCITLGQYINHIKCL